MKPREVLKNNVARVGLAFVVVAFLVGAATYSQMPEQMATHWNSSGVADGYSGKFVGVWGLPLVMLGTYLLLVFLPYIDPNRKNIERFSKQWFWFIAIFEGFFLYLYVLSLWWNGVGEFNFGKPLIGAIGVLFIVLSRLIAVAKQNYTIGIRTPWTLANETSWDKTHSLGAKLFLGLGLLTLLGIIKPVIGVVVLIGGAVLVLIISMVYSYQIYKQETKK